MKGRFGQREHSVHVVMERVDRRFGPELLVPNHRVHDGIEASSRRPMASRIIDCPIDQLMVSEAIADQTDTPMLIENQIGRRGQNVFLGNNRMASGAKPSLDFDAFVTAEDVVGKIIAPRCCSPPIPSCPFGFGFDVKFIVMRHLLASLSHKLITDIGRVLGFACQRVGKRILDERVVLLRFGFYEFQEPRGPRVIAYLDLNLINLCLGKQEIGVPDGDTFLFRRRRDPELSDDEKTYSEITEPSFEFHCTFLVTGPA